MDRKAMIQMAIDSYFAGLANRDFEQIPFATTIRLRAPLTPGGSDQPLSGIEMVRDIW